MEEPIISQLITRKILHKLTSRWTLFSRDVFNSFFEALFRFGLDCNHHSWCMNVILSNTKLNIGSELIGKDWLWIFEWWLGLFRMRRSMNVMMVMTMSHWLKYNNKQVDTLICNQQQTNCHLTLTMPVPRPMNRFWKYLQGEVHIAFLVGQGNWARQDTNCLSHSQSSWLHLLPPFLLSGKLFY